MAAKHLPQVLHARVIVCRQTIVYGAEEAQVGGEMRGNPASVPRMRGNRILRHGNDVARPTTTARRRGQACRGGDATRPWCVWLFRWFLPGLPSVR